MQLQKCIAQIGAEPGSVTDRESMKSRGSEKERKGER